MPAVLNLPTGTRFGKLTLIADVTPNGRGPKRWLVRCECGREKEAAQGHLVARRIASCGRCRWDATKLSPGDKFGALTLLNQAAAGVKTGRWVCLCDCGVRATAEPTSLRRGKTTSCGCLRGAKNIRHGQSRHGRSPEYRCWKGIKSRCSKLTNPKTTAYYAGRGIEVCVRWRESFEAFLEDMGRKPSPKHSIDRIDVNGNYEPGNCRWATQTEQVRNRTDTFWITWRGQKKALTSWAEELGIKGATIRSRLGSGWDVDAAMTTPVRSRPAKARLDAEMRIREGLVECWGTR